MKKEKKEKVIKKIEIKTLFDIKEDKPKCFGNKESFCKSEFCGEDCFNECSLVR